MGKTNGSNIERMEAKLDTLSCVVKNLDLKITAFMAGTGQRCIDEDKRLVTVENRQEEHNKWLIGSLFAALLAILSTILSWVFRK